MAQPTTTTTARFDAIKTFITSQVAAAVMSTEDHATAKDAADQAGENKLGTRMAMMAACATASHNQQWTEGEITSVTKAVVAANNGDKSRAKTVGTLVSEIRNAAHPGARAHVGTIIDVAGSMWDALEADKSDGATNPLKTCWSRRYHMLTGLFKQAADGNVLTDPDDIITYARANDPSKNAERVAKRIAKIVEDLRAMHADFPDEDLGMVCDTLGKLTEADLVASRADRATKTTTVVEVPVVPEPVVPVKPAPVVVETHTVMQGACDLEDLLAAVGLTELSKAA